MTWETSMSVEGWEELRNKIEALPLNKLIEYRSWQKAEMAFPISECGPVAFDDYFRILVNEYDELLFSHPSVQWALHDGLADEIYQYAHDEVRTCDNGGFVIHLTRDGYITIKLED